MLIKTVAYQTRSEIRMPSKSTLSQNTQSASVRWQAVLDAVTLPSFFVYAVCTTGIYCVPSCPSKRPLQENSRFFESCSEAKAAGFRACLRCLPDMSELSTNDLLIDRACQRIANEPSIELSELAKAFGYSASHFQRVFSASVGISPKQFALATRRRRAEDQLAQSSSVTESIYSLDSSAPSRFHNDLKGSGLSAADRLRGASQARIHWTTVETRWGLAGIAATSKGVCAIELADDSESIEQCLMRRFKNALLLRSDGPLQSWSVQLVQLVDQGTPPHHLSLDLRCTSFQAQVWALLAKIPRGQTTTYKKLAESLGRPKASRAIATAVAANPLAVIIPCHRVIRQDGGLADYRWGKQRKAKLLQVEVEA